MKDPKQISIADYTYALPDERIAAYPLPDRDASKLLIYKKAIITEDVYSHIASHIPENSLLLFNNTKVVEARLLFQKNTGGTIELFCLEPHSTYPDITSGMLQKGKVLWHCLVGGASKWKTGQVLEKKINIEKIVSPHLWRGPQEIILQANYVEKKSDSFIIEFAWKPDHLSFAEILHYAGAVPLPPYIKRTAEQSDVERYQTVYAQYDGSVAAPTAGLHFTENVFHSLKEKNIVVDFLTLHVGAGTFKPVKSQTMDGHDMHAEFIDVSKRTIQRILDNLNNNIVAVGTTSLRTMESLYWLGVKSRESIQLLQWEAYELAEKNIPVKEALESLLAWMEAKQLDRLIAKTQLLIVPGYPFKIVKGLITNFHQPQSTLLLLVAAFVGKGWKSIYEYALENEFRFLSYGDGSLLWRD